MSRRQFVHYESILPFHIFWTDLISSTYSISVFLHFSFTLKQKNGDGGVQEVETTVYDYFTYHRRIPLQYSGELPCINVGKPKHPTFIPLEVLDN